MKRYVFVCSLLVAVLSSCSQGNEESTRPEAETRAVTFGVSGVDTRGAETTTASISEFSVFCFNTAAADWATAGTTALPEKMYNQRVERNGNDWTYDPPVLWGGVSTGYHTFLGYSPSAKGAYDPLYNPSGNNITVQMQATPDGTDVPRSGAQLLDFEVMPHIGNQVDLLRSAPHYDLSALTPVVKMQFQHTLSCVGFRAYSGIAGTSVDEIRIAGLLKKGTLNLETGVWTIDPTEKATYVYDQQTFVTTDGSNPTQLSHPSDYFMMLPQDFSGASNTGGLKIEIAYTQEGKQLTKTYILKENWAMGKRILYTIDLGGTPSGELNVVEIEITDWQFAYGGELQTGDQFTLTLNANGGELGSVIATQKRLAGSYDPLTLQRPTRTDWTFTHWNELSDGNGAAYGAGERFRMPKADATLYAQWGKEYTLTYNENQGDATLMPAPEKRVSTTSRSPEMPRSYNADAGVGEAAYKHLIFREWNTQPDGQGTSYTSSDEFTMPAADVTLYAQWDKQKYMLIYMMNDDPSIDPDAGTAWQMIEDIEHGTVYQLSDQYPSRTGYTFTGWNTAPDGNGTAYATEAEITVTQDVGLYAQWAAEPAP